jgi:glutathione S-transferase
MSPFIVHSVPGSPFGRAVLITLFEKNAQHRLVPVAPGTMRSASHLARHPFGRVPVLEHNGTLLYETQAIVRYLDRVLPTPALTPASVIQTARMDQVMNINDWYLFQGVNNVIGFQRVVAPRLMGLSPDEKVIADAMPKAHAVFGELSRLLGDQTFFTGDALSLADIMVVPHLDLLSETPEWQTLTANAPNLVAWLARMNARPSVQATTWSQLAQQVAATPTELVA